ncbi:MAG: L-threonine 3-dehydrogenase [Bacillati bacterium ANGP1]|uniref:L-threonine 3-dehydrogenase n=1 Tax=Candidatus Segetimicrobium genomatis TaxID=2569760 RepID=A0A537J1E8_9BACT|nr:MAG: L-threonine 3-dehydrogenase [Terrabacteria group bacterium ANGP1]
MKALIKPDAGPGLELTEVPVPRPGPGEILVKVFGGGICGTDLHIFMWDAWARSRVVPPRVIGHEFCGTIAGLAPGVTGLAVGDFISGEGHISCGRCHACRTGTPHICERLEVIGIDRDGAFAEYVAMPAANAWKIDPTISRDVAAIMDPLGNAVHAALETSLAAKRVAVIGCGPIGLMAVAICHLVGAVFVAATDVSDARLALARRMGADLVLDARTEDVPARIREAIDGEGVDVVLEMSGSERGLQDGLRALRNGGWVSVLGLPSAGVRIDLADGVIFKGAHLVGIFGRKVWQTWEQGTALLRNGLDITPVITHRFPLERFEEAFDLLRAGTAGKVLLYV